MPRTPQPLAPGAAASRSWPFRAQRRRPRRRGGDRGNLVALEGVFVGMLMVTSVAIVASLQSEDPSIPVERPILENHVGDLLASMDQIATNDRYSSQLERVIGQAVLGNGEPLEKFLRRALPPGCDCTFWVDNGRERRLLVGDEDPPTRQSVSASKLWRPTWAYAFAVPSFDVISTSQPLDIQGYAVSQGTMVKEAGVPVQVNVTTSQGVYTVGTVTGVHAAPTVSMYLLNETGKPAFTYKDAPRPVAVHVEQALGPLLPASVYTIASGVVKQQFEFTLTAPVAPVTYTLTFRAPGGATYQYPGTCSGTCVVENTVPAAPGLWTLTTSFLGVVSQSSIVVDAASSLVEPDGNWTIAIRHDGGAALPKGTALSVRLPHVFGDPAKTLTYANPGWTNVTATKTSQEGVLVRAEMGSALTAGERRFILHSERPLLGGMHLLRAELDNGTRGRAVFVVGEPGLLTETSSPVQRGVYVTAPKPVAPGATTTWGMAFAFPSPSLIGSQEVVTAIDVVATDGRALFAAAQGISPATGWSVVGPGHLRWSGTMAVVPNTAQHFVVNVTAAAAASDHEPRRKLPVEFASGAKFDLLDQTRPYVFGGSIPPGTHGYQVPTLLGAVPMGKANATIETAARGMRVSGTVGYNVTTFAPLGSLADTLRLGLARSHVNLSAPTARVGEQVNVSVDLQGLYAVVESQLGSVTGWNVTLTLLDPAQPFGAREEWKPSYRGTFGSSANLVLASEAKPGWSPVSYELRSKAAGNFTFAPPRNAFFGPHAILAEGSFSVSDGLGNSVVQTARLLAVLDVVPDMGQSATAHYWVTLQCWLPDW